MIAKVLVCLGAGLGYWYGAHTVGLDVIHGAIYGGMLGAGVFLVAMLGTEALGWLAYLGAALAVVGLVLVSPYPLIVGAVVTGVVCTMALFATDVGHANAYLATLPDRDEEDRQARAAMSARMEAQE